MGVLFPNDIIILVLRTTYQINNPFYHAKQKSNNPVQSSPAINPADNVATFRMSFFESRNFSLEIGFWIFFSGHIINRLVISSIEKSRRKNRKKCLRVKCELESSCFSNSLFSTIVLVVNQYKPASNANICVISSSIISESHHSPVLICPDSIRIQCSTNVLPFAADCFSNCCWCPVSFGKFFKRCFVMKFRVSGVSVHHFGSSSPSFSPLFSGFGLTPRIIPRLPQESGGCGVLLSLPSHVL